LFGNDDELANAVCSDHRPVWAEFRVPGQSAFRLLRARELLPECACDTTRSCDTEDAHVVLTPAKNYDGELGPRSVWERKAGWFELVTEFDREGFDSGSAKREPKVNEGHIRELFENGRRKMALKQAAERLQEIAEVGRSAAYEALKLTGCLGVLLARDADTGLIGMRPLKSPDAERGSKKAALSRSKLSDRSRL